MNEQLSEKQVWLSSVLGVLLAVRSDDPVRVRRGRLVNLVLLVVLGVTLVVLGVTLGAALAGDGGAVDSGALLRVVFFGVVLGAAYVLNRQVASPLAGVFFALAVLAVDVVALMARGPLSPGVIGLTLPVLIAGLLGAPGAAFLLASLASLAYVWVNVQHDAAYWTLLLDGGAESGTIVVYFNLYLVATLAWLFARMAGRAIRESHAEVVELRARQVELEGQLERQIGGLRATVNVARGLARARGLNTLLRDGVKLVWEQFGRAFQVRIYLMDESGEFVVLRESVGGKVIKLLSKGDRVSVGSLSAVGRAAEGREPVFASGSFARPRLARPGVRPKDRAEVAVPLLFDGVVVGVLQLQGDAEGGVDESLAPALLSLAEQLAIAIQNARMYDETQHSLRELGALSKMVTQTRWREFLRVKGEDDRVFEFGSFDDAMAVRRVRVVERVMEAGNMVAALEQGEDAPGYLAVPMILRGEIIGVVGVEVDGERQWSQDDVMIIESVAQRVALAVENARLFEQVNHTVQQQQLVNAITEKLQRAPDLELLLEEVANELQEALGVDEVYAELAVSSSSSEGGSQKRVDGAVNVNGRLRKVLPNGSDVEELSEVEGEKEREAASEKEREAASEKEREAASEKENDS